ncbi:MAG: UTP--glucose-1-phosphate uridylyltransferase [Spirochaetia bacterium]|nr:UTP--glucose-1-phosphate uridylyltransferase [Spirochaetia bacterium]
MKGLILAAGYGTRFLPASKTVPKELFPLIDKPAIAFLIEEFAASGIRDIVLITSRRKKSLEDYFDREIELETLFKSEGAEEKLLKIKPYDINLTVIRQQEMNGTGHAMLQARSVLQDSAFITAYPDDLHFGKIPLSRQLIDVYNETGCTVLSTLHDPPELLRYGVLALADDGFHVTDIVEKPVSLEAAPSREGSIGRFLYTPDIFEYLQEGWDKHSGGEYYHVYALKKLMEKNLVVHKKVEGLRLDTGAPEGYLRAILTYAAMDPDLRKIILEEASYL